MKILIDARTLGSHPSGVGIYIYRYIKELVETKHEVILVTDVATSDEMRHLQESGTQIICYGKIVYRSVQVLRYFSFVRNQLMWLQPDIFWEPNNLIPSGLSGYHGKVMVTIHDIFPITHAKYFSPIYSMYFKVMLHRTSRIADIILFSSQQTQGEARQLIPRLTQATHHVLYPIVPRIEANTQSTSKDYFLYVGNMEKRKGVDILLMGYDLYRQRGGTSPLILAGKKREDDVDAMIQTLVQKYPEVEYRGYVSDDERETLYKNCSLFAFPSCAEGFGMPLIEAMNYYKPILASDLSVFHEIAGESINYFAIDGDITHQAESLMQGLFDHAEKVDACAYDSVMSRYEAGVLGNRLMEIVANL